MTAAEASVLGLAVALCGALWATRDTAPRAAPLLAALAVLAVLVVVLRRCGGTGGA